MLKVRTLSPVRSPISADSERRAADTLKQMAEAGSSAGGLVNLLAETDTLSSFEWPWANGYGTLEHDNLPAFFQPFACYSVAMGDVSLPSDISQLLVNNGGAIECCRLYLYDDTVALLQLDVAFETSESGLGDLLRGHSLDGALSNLAKRVYEHAVYPAFHQYALGFRKSRRYKASGAVSYLRDPKKLTVFRDVSFDSPEAPDTYVLWTGRYVVTPPSTLNGPLGDSLRLWASYTGSTEALLEARQFVGSGNILAVADDAEAQADNWLRGLSVCQLYNAVLSIYGGILKSSYSELNDFAGSRHRSKDLHRLMADITKTLDHLEFTRLEFNEAIIGVQAERAKVVRAAYAAWNLGELIEGSLERTSLIRSKISRLLEARKSQLDRSVELILAGIGGVAVIDLFISLTTASRSLDRDDIPGVLDVFEWLQPDGSIALSTTILVLISFYIYLAKR
ncbi:MAG: hypothetical protein VX673_04770 [Pseudomonadota bacterium]|jgi:hypothetical protein|uniref:hypothetical protein n=1 Tax=Marinobacter sp. C1S70 TaxID=1396859 RepID=UPI0003B8A96D|nr:hypothetical protein [Marinobacter sp. C1S70]ERS84078.1 hypothetical protein Q667_18485 [Marinobacter sp. C1S70]MEC8823267.1 hypothetical protein [Pseudomonadota bacterium]MEC9385951.1 hypothetical protein [Pseudomonadota bacterium]